MDYVWVVVAIADDFHLCGTKGVPKDFAGLETCRALLIVDDKGSKIRIAGVPLVSCAVTDDIALVDFVAIFVVHAGVLADRLGVHSKTLDGSATDFRYDVHLRFSMVYDRNEVTVNPVLVVEAFAPEFDCSHIF